MTAHLMVAAPVAVKASDDQVALKLCSLTERLLADAVLTAAESRMAAIRAVRPSFVVMRIAFWFFLFEWFPGWPGWAGRGWFRVRVGPVVWEARGACWALWCAWASPRGAVSLVCFPPFVRLHGRLAPWKAECAAVLSPGTPWRVGAWRLPAQDNTPETGLVDLLVGCLGRREQL